MTDVLQIGVTSEDVMDVQDRLRFLRYFEGSIDGTFTSTTETAVASWQEAMGETPTGTLDEHGVHKLREYSNSYHYGHGAMYADYDHHDDYHGHVEHHHHHGHAGHVEHHGDADGHDHGHLHQSGHGHAHQPDQQGHVGAPTAEDVVVGNGDEYYAHVLQTITNVEEHTLLLAKLNDDAYLRGVQMFQHFINGKIAEEEESDALSGHVAMQVARSICDAVGIYACGKIVWPVFKYIAEQISMGIAHSTSKISFAHFASGDANAMRAFWGEQMYGLARERANVEKILHDNVREAFRELREVAQNRRPIPPAHTGWLAHAFENGGAALDEVSEGLFGIQGTAKLPQVEQDVYAKLYEDWYKEAWGSG